VPSSSFTGEPGILTFKSETMSRVKDAYNLTWSVNSYTPIEEYKVYLRKAPEDRIEQNEFPPNPWAPNNNKIPPKVSLGISKKCKMSLVILAHI